MEIIVGKLSGFCAGVENTIKKAKEALEENEKVYCIGEIVHNERVIKGLEANGMITVQSIEEVPNGSKVIFRAHGEAKKVYSRARELNLQVIDLTCGKVRIIHREVEKRHKDTFILIIGKKIHPEIIGTKGFAGENSFVIENEDDILKAFDRYKESGLKKIYVVSQTTFSNSKFKILTDVIKNTFKATEIEINNTICDATEKRQLEVEELSKKVTKMFIIGGKNSSNTKELAEIAKKNCKDVFLIQEVDDLKEAKVNKEDIVGIMSGASTPKEIIDEVKQAIIAQEM